jgi:hypothetical protein
MNTVKRSIALQGRAAEGPQFAKVYVRLVDWAAAEAQPASYQHSSWADPFVLTEVNLAGTVEELTTVAICRWGRSVVPFASLYLANGGGRMLEWSASDDGTGHQTAVNISAAALVPLDPCMPIASIPRFELPLAFVLLTRPSSFVPQGVVVDILSALQHRVIREKEEPLQAIKDRREQQRALDEQRKLRIAEMEDAQRRREVKAVLQSHQREDARLVHMHQTKNGPSALLTRIHGQ